MSRIHGVCHLVGIDSWGIQCGDEVGAFYTRASAFDPFIRQHVTTGK